MVDRNLNENQTDEIRNLYDATVYGQDGEKIGGVSQVYLDDQTGRPSWATVSTGWFGSKDTFVPLDDARFEGDRIDVPYTKDFVKDAPNVDADTHLSEAEESELYRYYSKSYDDGRDVDHDVRDRDAAGVGAAGVAGRDRDLRDDRDVVGDRHDHDRHDHDLRDRDRHDGDGDSMVRHEEEVHVSKERVATGRLRLRKHVVTEHETVTVPVEGEEYVLEREPIADGERGGRMGDVGEDEISVTVHEERPVVEKEVVAKERVGLAKETHTEERQVTTERAREEISMDREGDHDLTDRDRKDRDGNPLT